MSARCVADTVSMLVWINTSLLARLSGAIIHTGIRRSIIYAILLFIGRGRFWVIVRCAPIKSLRLKVCSRGPEARFCLVVNLLRGWIVPHPFEGDGVEGDGGAEQKPGEPFDRGPPSEGIRIATTTSPANARLMTFFHGVPILPRLSRAVYCHDLYRQTPAHEARPTTADRHLAEDLHRQGVPAELLRAALLLVAARRAFRAPEGVAGEVAGGELGGALGDLMPKPGRAAGFVISRQWVDDRRAPTASGITQAMICWSLSPHLASASRFSSSYECRS